MSYLHTGGAAAELPCDTLELRAKLWVVQLRALKSYLKEMSAVG